MMDLFSWGTLLVGHFWWGEAPERMYNLSEE